LENPESESLAYYSEFLKFFGVEEKPADFAVCQFKQFVKIRDDYCKVEFSTDADKEKCIADTKESLGMTAKDEDTEKEACWDIKVKGAADQAVSETNLNTAYTKKPKCTCTAVENSDPVEHSCTCCFKSKKTEEHAENELEVTDARDTETISQIETAARNMRELSSVT